jgi:hypothetical protein
MAIAAPGSVERSVDHFVDGLTIVLALHRHVNELGASVARSVTFRLSLNRFIDDRPFRESEISGCFDETILMQADENVFFEESSYAHAIALARFRPG